MKNLFYAAACGCMLLLTSCSSQSERHQKEVQQFLDNYNNKYRELYTASSEGQWLVNTRIVEGDTMNAWKSRQADEALAFEFKDISSRFLRERLLESGFDGLSLDVSQSW